jgi:3-deoxy-manno-octulosonate cytidylyltransferase (CMP-KDO synthetase)
MASTRLPNKPLADICGLPMIVQVWHRAMAAQCGRVVVAAAEPEVADAVIEAGGEAVLTDPDLPSGSDRIYAALQQIDSAGAHDAIINLQGDLPNLDPKHVQTVLDILPGFHISTLVAEISSPEERDNPNVVKAVLSMAPGATSGRALYFSRAAVPTGEGLHYHHIGIYGYQRWALEKFVSLAPSPLEKRERLEQLRALEAGMNISAACVETVPVGVDTQADLELADRLLSGQN